MGKAQDKRHTSSTTYNNKIVGEKKEIKREGKPVHQKRHKKTYQPMTVYESYLDSDSNKLKKLYDDWKI